jgi:hypothetical protein
VVGPISRPERAPISAAIVKASRPAALDEMPMRRAPARFTAVARSALPVSVRSKNRYSSTMSATEAKR